MAGVAAGAACAVWQRELLPRKKDVGLYRIYFWPICLVFGVVMSIFGCEK
jgi:hypothetical protein